MRQVHNIQVFYYRADLQAVLRKRYRVLLQVGKVEHKLDGRVTLEQFRTQERLSQTTPVCYAVLDGKGYWRFAGRWYVDTLGLDPEAARNRLLALQLKEQAVREREADLVARGDAPLPGERRPVHGDVRAQVFRRDGGRCVACGGDADLQIDHVVPVRLGGGNSAGNLQVLCGPCNRRKGASVATPVVDPPAQADADVPAQRHARAHVVAEPPSPDDDAVAPVGAVVHVTGTGQKFHRDPDCGWLRRGQADAARRGGTVTALRGVTLEQATALGRSPCRSCAQQPRPAGHRTRG